MSLLIFTIAFNDTNQDLAFSGNMSTEQAMFLMQLIYKEAIKQEARKEFETEQIKPE